MTERETDKAVLAFAASIPTDLQAPQRRLLIALFKLTPQQELSVAELHAEIGKTRRLGCVELLQPSTRPQEFQPHHGGRTGSSRQPCRPSGLPPIAIVAFRRITSADGRKGAASIPNQGLPS
jgi:hypothetical protein